MNGRKSILKRVVISAGLLTLTVSLYFFFLRQKKFKYGGFFFDTCVRIIIYERNYLKGKNTIKKLLDEFETIDKMKVKNIGSGKINRNMKEILNKSIEIAEISGGFFDPTVDLILREWEYFNEKKIPEKRIIDSLINFVNYRKIEIKNDSLILPLNFSLNIGGIAKGYALQKAESVLKKNRIKSALVEAGGEILLMGSKKGRESWKIGIKHPRQKNKLIATMKLKEAKIATSGDYERYFLKNGKRYHHIINPHTGFPSTEIQSVTLTGNDAQFLDGFSTALLAMEIDSALKYVKKFNLSALIVDSTGNIHNFLQCSSTIITESLIQEGNHE